MTVQQIFKPDFVIVGAGRGGTSLLAGLLDSHRDLTVGFETGGVRGLMGRSILGRLRMPLWQLDSRLAERRGENFLKYCRRQAAGCRTKLWGVKVTTEQIAGLADHNQVNPGAAIDPIDFFFGRIVPEAKVVFILRDGRTCVRSKTRRTGQQMTLACERWNFSVSVCRYLQQHPERARIVKFEELLDDPQGRLEAVMDLLGVAFDPGMLNGTESRIMPGEYRREGFDASTAKLDDVPDGCEELMEDGLRYCGYID